MSESDKNPTASRSFEPYGASNEERTNPIDTQGAQARAPGEPMQPSSISGEPRTLIPTAQPIRDPLLETDPLRVPPRQGPANPLSIGRSDLDPFQFDPTGSGGMIFDPFRNMQHQRDIPRNLPPGAVPPGARFDPFGPPNPDDLTPGSIGPNPSHLRKPDFGDDLGGGFGRGRGGFGGGGFGGGGFGGGGFL